MFTDDAKVPAGVPKFPPSLPLTPGSRCRCKLLALPVSFSSLSRNVYSLLLLLFTNPSHTVYSRFPCHLQPTPLLFTLPSRAIYSRLFTPPSRTACSRFPYHLEGTTSTKRSVSPPPGFHGHAINHFVTSRIKHTPYETFLAVYFLFLQLRHAINHFVASSSRNLDFDWPRSLFYLSTVHVSNSRDSNFPAVSLRSCETKKDLF